MPEQPNESSNDQQKMTVTCFQCPATIEVPSVEQGIADGEIERHGWEWFGQQPVCWDCVVAAEQTAEDEDNARQESHDRMIAAQEAEAGPHFIVTYRSHSR